MAPVQWILSPMSPSAKKLIDPTFLQTLKHRFEKHMNRHPSIKWEQVEARLTAASANKIKALQEMEATGGEPDVVGDINSDGALCFMDCAAESPAQRRSLCYDDEALKARKEHAPAGSATGRAAAMGAELLTEEQYRSLQQTGEYDLKTSSWLMTPPEVRKLGGSIFGDRRYGRVFVYHNGAQSYYASRGYRVVLFV